MELVPNDALDKELARYLAEAPAGVKPLLKRVTTEHPSWDGVDTKRVREAMARLATTTAASSNVPASTLAPMPSLGKGGKGKKKNRRAGVSVTASAGNMTNTDARSKDSAVAPARKRDEVVDEFQRMKSPPRNRLECGYITSLRFKPGQFVLCFVGDDDEWVEAEVALQWFEDDDGCTPNYRVPRTV
jgi:hypothetical protein